MVDQPITAPTKRRWLIGAGILLAAAASGYGWYWFTTPDIPHIDLTSADLVVVEAVKAAQHAVRQSPRSGPAWGELGMVLFANGYVAQSHPCFVQAERFEPDVPAWPYLQAWWLLLQDREAAMPVLRRAVARADQAEPHDPLPRLILAEILFEKDAGQARELCEQVLVRDPNNSRAQFDLGLIALSADNAEQSIEHLARSVGSPFTGKRSCLHLAAAYRRLGDADSAAAFLRRATDLPEDRAWPDSYVLKAKEYTVGPKAHMQRAEQVAEMGRPGDHLLALRDLAEESGDGLSHYRLGAALAAAGDYKAAEPVLRTALRKAPDLISAHFALGIVLFRQVEAIEKKAAQKKIQEAAGYLKRAVELKPTHGLAHLYLGRCFQRLGRQAEALAEFRTAVQCRPDLAEAHFYLGEALEEAGDRDIAARHLEQASSLSPSDPRPRKALERLRSAK